MQQAQFVFVPYSYIVSSDSIDHTASNQQPLVLDADADFELHEIRGYTDQDAATDYRPNNFSVQVTDKNNSRIWSSDQIGQVAMEKLILTRPVLLAKRSNLLFDFTNITSATDGMTCTIVFHGFKVYASRAASPTFTGA